MSQPPFDPSRPSAGPDPRDPFAAGSPSSQDGTPDFAGPSAPGTHSTPVSPSGAAGAYPGAGTTPTYSAGTAPTAGYPQGAAYPQAAGYTPAAMPGAPMPTTPPKKKRTGLIALIIVLAVILVGAGVFFGVRAVIGHRLTSYCQTYISLSDDMTNWSQELSDAATAGDAEKISSSLDSMITGFAKLQDANPPDTVAPALDSFVKGFTAVKQATDTDGLEGFLGSFTAYTNEISEAGKTIDDASVAYCN